VLARGANAADGVIHLAFIHDFANYAASAEADRTAITAMAGAIGARLGVPVESIPRERVMEHVGWIGGYFSLDKPVSSAKTRAFLGREPTHVGLIKVLDGFVRAIRRDRNCVGQQRDFLVEDASGCSTSHDVAHTAVARIQKRFARATAILRGDFSS
jgi:hypothetical protein